MKRFFAFAVITCCAFWPCYLNAQEEPEANGNGFSSFGFGSGIAYVDDFSATPRVDEAEIVNGIVRITKRSNKDARIILESHVLPFGGIDGFPWCKCKQGPFIAISPGGSDQLIESFGAGWMFAWRAGGTRTWNIGLGAINDLSVQIFGDGFNENQPPPNGETEIRFLEKNRLGLLLVFSYGFGIGQSSNGSAGTSTPEPQDNKATD